jgi:phenylpyruvate tautomerase PptA (4-oxalocrotonate tautomerase family)
MPNIRIETRSGWITSPETIISAVHGAVSEVLKLPVWDRTVRLVEHLPSHFPPPPDRGERFTLVEVTMFAGRSLEAKRMLYRTIVSRLEAAGVPASDVSITLIEVAAENWGIRGGQPASEVELGFKVDV